MYGLADCNNFYASCERMFAPDLNGRPVVVLSNNDGCIIARSDEAKALGLKMGDAYFQQAAFLRQNNVAVFSSNLELYGDMSTRVMNTLKSYSPVTEVYSIDESFMDFTGIDPATLRDFGLEIVQRVKKNTGIPISLGIAPTKTLAKIASKLCKQYPKLAGCCYMHRPEDIEKVLRRFPIGDVGHRETLRKEAAGRERRHGIRLHAVIPGVGAPEHGRHYGSAHVERAAGRSLYRV